MCSCLTFDIPEQRSHTEALHLSGFAFTWASYLLVDGSAVGRLDQDLNSSVREFFDVTGGQGRPPLPRVDILAADGHNDPTVFIAPLSHEAPRPPLTLKTEDPEHDCTSPAQAEDKVTDC